MTKDEVRKYYDRMASEYDGWKQRNWYYYLDLQKCHRFIVPANQRVLEIGCGTGDLLNALKPSRGLGIDISQKMIEIAKKKYPDLEFKTGDAECLNLDERFDYVVMSNLIGSLNDIWQAFRELKKVVHSGSRVVITYYNYLWEPVLKIGEKLGAKMRTGTQNWLPLSEIENLLYLNNFEVVSKGYRFLVPRYIPIISRMFNDLLARLPLLRKLCLTQYVVARHLRNTGNRHHYSCSVIIPCRNEVGNIEPAVQRMPELGKHTEVIFVDGYSVDGTVEKLEEVVKRNPEKDIKVIDQIPRSSNNRLYGEEYEQARDKMLKLGKGDAVRKGFQAARGDILIILDADLTVPPEELPKFYLALAEGKGEFVNGSRLVYPMERQAMRIANVAGNKLFSLIFTWLLDQPIRDTLCGTKALFKKDYLRIENGRRFFGDFDPFGDFDLLLGAAKLNVKIVQMPVRYVRRTQGDTKISRWKHGWLLLKMSVFAIRKLRFS